MPFNSNGFVNTENLTVSTPSTGVMNQLRFWGMGQGQQRQGTPELHSKMMKYQLDSSKNLADLENRALQLRLSNDKGLMTLQAGQAEDASTMKQKQFDSQQPDGLDKLARGAAGIAAAGGMVAQVSGVLGEKFDSSKLKALEKTINKLPLVGVGRKNAKMQEEFDASMEALKKEGVESAKFRSRLSTIYKGLETSINNMNARVDGLAPQDLFDDAIEDFGFTTDLLDDLSAFNSYLDEYEVK